MVVATCCSKEETGLWVTDARWPVSFFLRSELEMSYLSVAALPTDDPDLEAPAAAANMHHVTGTFADPSHESAFAAQLFRMAYPTHVLLMALVLTHFTWSVLVEPDMRAFWVVSVSAVGLGLLCRVLLHRTGRHDPVRSQWKGSWAWIVLTAPIFAAGMVNVMVAPAAACEAVVRAKYMVPFVNLSMVLVNGTHGLDFACKVAVIAMTLIDCVVKVATCHNPELDPWLVCTMGVIVLVSATTHTAELFLRRSYAEKVQAKIQEQQSLAKEAARGRQLEERNEQLKAEKERLLYDVQRHGRSLDDNDDRNAIRRGLLAGSSQPCLLNGGGMNPNEPGGAPSDTPLTLPPGPPSSASSGSMVTYGQLALEPLEALLPDRAMDAGAAQQSIRMVQAQVDAGAAQQSVRMVRLAEGAGAQSSAAALTAPASWLEILASEPEVMEAVLTNLMADETTVLELQGMLGPPPADRTNPEMFAGVRVVRQRVVAHRVQEAVNSTPPTPPEATLMPAAEWLTETCNELDEGHNDGGAGSEPQGPHLPVSPPGSLDPDQGSMTPRQRALHVARQHMQIARTNIESYQVVQTLAVALGAGRVEGGTIKALLAVLLQMDRPGMSESEAYTSTGASLSNFQRWRRRVQYAQLDLPPPT
jgi:hypothetical protein